MASLQHPATAVAGADGVATAFLPAVPFAERWNYSSVSVQSTSTARSTVTLYRNVVSRTSVIDSAPNTGNNNTTDTIIELQPSERVVVQWTGCTPGAVCTANALGDSIVRAR